MVPSRLFEPLIAKGARIFQGPDNFTPHHRCFNAGAFTVGTIVILAEWFFIFCQYCG
jgi:hypothetical protein